MEIKGIVPEDFLQYKKPSMVVLFPTCDFKCDRECGSQVCQNCKLALASSISADVKEITKQYMENFITQAICFGGLEPFDSFDGMLSLVKELRNATEDDIVIFTGYYENEISEQIEKLKVYPNIIVKFGRFIPGQEKHFDPVLEIMLASDNQYGKLISDTSQKGTDMDNTEKKLKIRQRPIIDEDDQELVDTINEGLERNKELYGKRYCPCSLERTDDTVCPCKNFREQTEPGFCHCGKFEKYYEE